ncbi:TH1 domain-containing protein [Citrus sinensis]|uniref:TH1 domain-containing protein n=1 Tax=Citrus sinensis TaxID=2711 RepID=A0ACB8HRG2_CITSI|nr:TH1 domain-containing protein [Citrus sinensis]
MDRYRPNRRVQIEESEPPKYDDVEDEDRDGRDDDDDNSNRLRPSENNVTEDQEPFMGIKVRRKASLHRDYKGDYLDVASHPYLMKILQKQGDKQVLFADKILKFTGSGKMKRRILLITDFAIYLVDPETDALKRRIALAAVEKMCLSELSDNFFAIIIPSEYDLLMASTRKTEIVTVLVEATKGASEELEVAFSNRICESAQMFGILVAKVIIVLQWSSFEYHAAAELVKEVVFEEVEGGIKTRILTKSESA